MSNNEFNLKTKSEITIHYAHNIYDYLEKIT